MVKRLLLLLALSTPLYGQLWSGVLSSARATDWTQAGIPGGIPSGSWTQCGATIAAYNGTGTTIVNALNHTGTGYTSCGSNTYIQLGAGTFNLTTGIRNVGVSNTELRGMGADQTHLVFTGTSTCQGGNIPCSVGFESSDGTYPLQPPTNIYNWTAGYAQGSNSITLSSGANITAGSTWIILDQCNTGLTGAPCAGNETDNGNFFECAEGYSSPYGCAGNGPDNGLARPERFEWEIVQATACSPACGSSGTTVVTISPPLQHPNWASGQTPQAWLIQPAQYVGVEDLSIDDSAITANSAGVAFNNCSYCWAKGVAVLNAYNIGIYIWQGLHDQIESNYVYNAGQQLTYADPTGIKHNGSDNLIENNIIEQVRPGILAEGPSNGSVIAYNYIVNDYTGDDFEFGSIWQHSTGDDYELYEGNVAGQAFEDQIHGSHLMETYYRNFFTGFESCANGQCGTYSAKASSVSAFEDLSYNRYSNIVANVLGTPGVETVYKSLNATEYVMPSPYNVYIIGAGNTGSTYTPPADPVVAQSGMLWGNYDVVNAATQWNTSEVPSSFSVYPNSVPTNCVSGGTCPASFYLSSRPSWWSSSIPFPAIGPDVAGGNVGIVAGTINTTGQFSGTPGLVGVTYGSNMASTAWAGHVNAIPAMYCYLHTMGGTPDGSGNALTFSRSACYTSVVPGGPPPAAPQNLFAKVVQ